MTTFIVLNWESAESKDNLHVDYMKWNKYSPFTSIVFYSGLLNSCFCSEPLFPVLQHQWDVSLSSSLLSAETSEATQEPVSVPSSSSVDLSELLLEIRHLRLQLERSIQTNTALRQRLEEQLLRGPNRSETININYLLSSPGKHKAQTRTLMTSDRYMEACKHTQESARSCQCLFSVPLRWRRQVTGSGRLWSSPSLISESPRTHQCPPW